MSIITDGWTESCPIVIDNVNVTANLSNYPMFLSHSATGFPVATIFSGNKRCQESGQDVRFASDALGVTELPREIVMWSNTSQKCIVWVKVPTVLTATDTTIYMFWGNPVATEPARTAPNGSEAVWNSSFSLVSHQNETAGNFVDQTSNNLTGTSTGLNFPEAIDPGALYISNEYDSADSNRVSWPHNTNQWATASGISISSIAYFAGFGSNHAIISKRTNSGTFNGWELISDTSGRIDFTVDFGANYIQVRTTAGLSLTTYYWIDVTWDGTDANGVKIYINGVLVAMTVVNNTTGTHPTNTDALGFGSRNGGVSANDMNGRMEEGYVYQGVMSAAWIQAKYHNQTNVAAFISAGSVTDHNVFPTDWDLTKFITLTVNPDHVRSTQTDYIGLIDRKQLEFVGKEADFWATVPEGGGSLRLATGLDGSGRLPLDVDICEVSNELLINWGKFPTITKGGGNLYYLFYSSDNTTYQPLPDTTYGKYKAHEHIYDCTRHHCSIQGTGVTSEFEDVSGSGNNGTGSVSPIKVRGLVGYAQEGDGLTKKIVLTDTGFPIGAAQRTMWSWLYVGVDSTEDSGITYGTNTTGNRYAIQQRSNGKGVHFSGNFRGLVELSSGWVHIVARTPSGVSGVLGTTKVEVLINGEQIFPYNLAASLPDTLNTILGFAYIGCAPGGAHNSKIWDECGLTTQYLSNDWVYLDYKMMSDTNNLWGAHVLTLQDILDAIDNIEILINNLETLINNLEVLINNLETLINDLVIAVKNRGFRRERPSRQEIFDEIHRTLSQVLDIQKDLKRFKLEQQKQITENTRNQRGGQNGTR